MSSINFMGILKDVVTSSAGYAAVSALGIPEMLVKGEGEMMASLRLGLAFTLSEEIAGYVLAKKPTVLQTGDIYRFADDLLFNSAGAFLASQAGAAQIIMEQMDKLPLPPIARQNLLPGIILVGNSAMRDLLDQMSFTNNQPSILYLTHPVFASRQMLLSQASVNGGPALLS